MTCGTMLPHVLQLREAGIKRGGIDRLDSTNGYDRDNCVPACRYCNYQKGTMTFEEFVENTQRRYEHLKTNGFIQGDEQ